jgi:mercuric reductase
VEIDEALGRLRALLPLAERQARLPGPVAEAHRAILRSFAERGRPLGAQEVAAVGGPGALAELARNDLVVLGTEGEVVGAYPVTTADTPHGLRLHGHALHAMCALDALAVAPLFDAEVEILSRCHVTGTPIRLVQRGDDLMAATPSDRVRVGIRWGPVGSTASGSL